MIDTSTKLNPHSVFTTCDNDSNRPSIVNRHIDLCVSWRSLPSFENKFVNDCTAESAFRFISQPFGYFLSEEFCFSKDFLFVISQLFHSSVDFTR